MGLGRRDRAQITLSFWIQFFGKLSPRKRKCIWVLLTLLRFVSSKSCNLV